MPCLLVGQEEKRLAAQARKEEADRKKKKEIEAKQKLEKDKAAAKAAALMDAMMDDGTDEPGTESVATDTEDTARSAAAAPSPSSKLASTLRKSVSRDGNGAPPVQARMAMIVQSFGDGDEGWDAEGGTTVAVDAGMAVRIVDDSSDTGWWEVTIPAVGDQAEQTGRIPAKAALSTAAGGKGELHLRFTNMCTSAKRNSRCSINVAPVCYQFYSTCVCIQGTGEL